MIRKSILDVNNVKYDSRFVKSQDYKFWIDLLELTRFAVIPEFLLYYRYHATQISKYKNKGLLSNRNILAERLIGRSLTNQELECHTLLLSREPNYQVIKAAEFEEWITLLKQSNNSKKKYIEPEFSKNIDKAKNDMYKRAINSSVITSKRYSPMCLIKILISRGKFFKYLPSITLFKLCGKCLLCLRK